YHYGHALLRSGPLVGTALLPLSEPSHRIPDRLGNWPRFPRLPLTSWPPASDISPAKSPGGEIKLVTGLALPQPEAVLHSVQSDARRGLIIENLQDRPATRKILRIGLINRDEPEQEIQSVCFDNAYFRSEFGNHHGFFGFTRLQRPVLQLFRYR